MNNLLLGFILGASVFGLTSIIIYIFLKKEYKILEKTKNKEQERESIILKELKVNLSKKEDRLNKKEDAIDLKMSEIAAQQKEISIQEKEISNQEKEIYNQEKDLLQKIGEIEAKKHKILKKELSINSKIEEIAKLTPEEAKKQIMQDVEQNWGGDIMKAIDKRQRITELKKKESAREIILNAIQQYSGDVTIETTQSTVPIPNDDFKGRLIGKEGRNIIAFERVTGVSLIIDDTPDTVFISSFDLFRRYIAKKSLEQLLEDKRIQPARIEEIVIENERNAKELIYNLGYKTLNDVGITDFPDEIISLVGKLRFRTSYGQNILKHSLEVGYIAEAIAKQIGADSEIALKGGILHDIGKSLDHDIEGTHPEIGGKLARQYNLDKKLINIIEGHHDGVIQTCIETKIVQIADAISAVRPGARRASVEQYLKRIKEMENLAASFSGVEKAFALSAGREVRIFVDAKTVSDVQAARLAKDIADDIESKLSYPGEVKVNLLRETRVIEYAK